MNYNNNISNGRNNSNGSTDSEESASRQNSLPAVHTSIVETTVGESSVLVSQNDVLEQYRGHLPRRKGHRRKAAEGCGGLSSTSWVFLSLALFQFLAVSGLQIVIAVLGRFDDDQLGEYVECLVNSVNATLRQESVSIPDNFDISSNSSFPQFGDDKQIYIYFFIGLLLYNFCLCVFALKVQNIVEVYAFVVLNILAMAYACLQVYQFRGFGISCVLITEVGYVALANVIILLVLSLIFVLLSLTIYVEFGWKTYRLLNCDPAMRYYYRVYEVLMSVIKIVLLFLLMFAIGQCILILPPHNSEFGPTILMAFVVLFVAYPLIYITVTYEWRFGYGGMFLIAFLLIAYCIFKIYRYSTLSCPVCMEEVSKVAMETQMIRNMTGIPDSISDGELAALFSLDRVEDFANTIMLAFLVMFFVLVAVIVFIHHLRFYNKGLKDYFAEQQPNVFLNQHCFKRCFRSNTYDVSDGPGNTKRLHLTAFRKRNRKARASQSSTTGDSRNKDTTKPGFKATGSPVTTNSEKVRRFSSIEETYTVPEPDFNDAPPTVGADWDNVYHRQ